MVSRPQDFCFWHSDAPICLTGNIIFCCHGHNPFFHCWMIIASTVVQLVTQSLILTTWFEMNVNGLHRLWVCSWGKPPASGQLWGFDRITPTSKACHIHGWCYVLCLLESVKSEQFCPRTQEMSSLFLQQYLQTKTKWSLLVSLSFLHKLWPCVLDDVIAYFNIKICHFVP